MQTAGKGHAKKQGANRPQRWKHTADLTEVISGKGRKYIRKRDEIKG